MNIKEARQILRDFWNESYHESEGEEFVPHVGNDPNCKLCQIEKEAIQKIENLTKHNSRKNQSAIKQ